MTQQNFYISNDKDEMMSRQYQEIIGLGVFTGLIIYFAIIGVSFASGLLALTGDFLYNWIITGSVFPAYGAGMVISWLYACHKDSGTESDAGIRKKIYVTSLSPIILYLIVIAGIIGMGQVINSFLITGISSLILNGILIVVAFVFAFIGIPWFFGVSPDIRKVS